MLNRNWQRWTVAFVIFIISAVVQRVTGPTYPVRGHVVFGGETIRYRLATSHGGPEDHQVVLRVADQSPLGILSYKRFKTADPWMEVPMRRDGDSLVAYLPHQPPAGKAMYQIRLRSGEHEVTIPPDQPVIIRFRGAVPPVYLATHILFMSLAMLFSNRAGLEALSRYGRTRRFVRLTIPALVIGGLVFGPIVQKFAFGSWWTGFPFGYDLTDNKTAIAFAFWLAAFFAGRGGRRARGWIVTAALVTLIVYLIPHSVLGSELDYANQLGRTPVPFAETGRRGSAVLPWSAAAMLPPLGSPSGKGAPFQTGRTPTPPGRFARPVGQNPKKELSGFSLPRNGRGVRNSPYALRHIGRYEKHAPLIPCLDRRAAGNILT